MDILKAYSDLSDIVTKMDGMDFDHIFWKQIESEDDKREFDAHINLINESQHWDSKLNWKKGRILEDFAVFLFERFQDVKVEKNKRPGDNETDIETQIGEKPKPPFMVQVIGQKIICECKNKKTSSIDVGMVVKLAEIMPTRGCKFGMFISILGMGGHGWRYGEGKRKKIMYKEGLPIISFTVNELKELRNGKNFYTMIKQKYQALVDEIDDDTADIPDSSHKEYKKRIIENLQHFKKCQLITNEEFIIIQDRITQRYGNFTDD